MMGGKQRQIVLTMVMTAISIVLCLPQRMPAVIRAFAEEEFSVQVGSAIADDALKVEILKPANEVQEAPKRILIYHTHTYEAYEQDPENPYVQLEKWRTKDEKHNIIAVGRALSTGLQALGFDVTHDTTAFEPPTLTDAYARSLSMLEKRQQDGEQYDLYIDLHRDAIASTTSIRRTVSVGDTQIARFMVLVGQGTTGGYAEKPDWQANKQIADGITQALNAQIEGLARDVKIKTGRFNQHVDDCCVLIECGTNWNTLEEVLSGIPYLAQAIQTTLMQE